jgi:hypothetical protein
MKISGLTEGLVSRRDLSSEAGQKENPDMATYTPPPYFPQSSLAPADKNRYRKFKLMVFGIGLLLLMALGGAVVGLIYLFKWLF